MTAKLYARTPNARPAKPLGPQAKVVWDALDATPRLATDVDKTSGPQFKTRQDTLRVTLYYILVFKKAGLVTAHENIAAETENAFAGTIPEELAS